MYIFSKYIPIKMTYFKNAIVLFESWQHGGCVISMNSWSKILNILKIIMFYDYITWNIINT
jgi:hypothetical protein